MPRKVVIIETQVKQYRKQFLLDLAARLRAADVELKVAYSIASSSERERADSIELDHGVGVKVPARWLFADRVIIQHVWPLVRDADLVIIEQSNKLLFNYVLLALSNLGLKRVAYWGHGYNRQERRPGLSELVKRHLVGHVDWWFAYTEGVARYLVERGVVEDRITVVRNTIDTAELTAAIEALAPATRDATRARLGIARDACVGVFCGALTAEKEIDFLLAAAAHVRRALPAFELLIVGDGPERALVEAAARRHDYVHYVGPVFGSNRAEFFAIADVLLMPALVGLAIVDGFAAGLPLVTTELPTHGPEIEYLEHRVNGLVTPHEVSAYADAVVATLSDRAQTRAMSAAARRTAASLTLPQMVGAFEAGILTCLDR